MRSIGETRAIFVAMRAQLVGKLREAVNGGEMALLTSVNGTIAALDALALDEPHDAAEPATRAVVSDAPGEPIALVLYAENSRVAAVVDLDPQRAIRLAGRLIAAAERRLSAVGSEVAAQNGRPVASAGRLIAPLPSEVLSEGPAGTRA